MIMMKSKVHAGPVQQLQFDVTKVVEKGDPETIAGARRTSTNGGCFPQLQVPFSRFHGCVFPPKLMRLATNHRGHDKAAGQNLSRPHYL